MGYVAKARTPRQRRHARIRKRMQGTADRPRLAVFRSHRHMSAQLVDDMAGRTLLTVTTTAKAAANAAASRGNKKTDAAGRLGRSLAEAAVQRGIRRVVFDRGGYRYHGRVKALADHAREGGLEF